MELIITNGWIFCHLFAGEKKGHEKGRGSMSMMYNPGDESYFTVTFSASSPPFECRAPVGLRAAVAFSVNAIIRGFFLSPACKFLLHYHKV